MDTQRLQDTIEEVVVKVVRPQFQRSHIMYNEVLAKPGEAVNVRGTRIPIEVNINPSNGWHSEGADLPASGDDEDAAFRGNYVRYSKAYEFTEDFMRQSESDEALVKGVSTRFKRYLRDIKVEFSQQMYGDGTGTKGVVASVVTGANGTVTFLTTTAWTYGASQLNKGMKLVFYNSSGTLHNAGNANSVCTIASIDHFNVTATFDFVPTDVVANDVAVYKGSWKRAIRGFGYHVPTSPGLQYQGVDTALYPVNPTIINAGGAPLTFSLMHKVKFSQSYKLDDEATPYIVTAPTQFDAAAMLGHNMRRYMSGENTLQSGFGKVKTDGVEWVKDPNAPEDTILYLDMAKFRKLELQPLGPKTVNGNQLFLKTSSTSDSGRADAVIGYLQWKGDVMGDEPRCQAKTYNLGMTGLVRRYQNMD